MISEKKIDDSFTDSQFLLGGCTTPYRLDSNSNGGGIFIREDIPSTKLHFSETGFRGFIELNLRINKWLVYFSDNA